MYKLSELNQDSFSAHHPVTWDGGKIIHWSQFIADVNAMRLPLRYGESDEWALFHTDTYRFAVGLMALLAENKTVYLPGENHVGLTTELQGQKINLVGQFPAARCQEILIEPPPGAGRALDLTGSIVIYTSGSTGAAKPITKTLMQLDRELAVLELNWGREWQDPIVASTVSHQHFYGLLFALLWPLCSGRRFCAKAFVDPSIMAKITNALGEAVWVMSPAHLHRLPQNMPWDEARVKVKTVFSSGGPLRFEAAQEVHQVLGRYPVEVLGSSETGGIASRRQLNPKSVWRPLPEVEICLDDEGALTVRSPWLEDSHWYATSDLATLCPEGAFRLGSRADRIVKLEGKRVVLPEVEAALSKHPWIEEAFVVVISQRRQILGAVLTLTKAGCAAEQKVGRHLFTRELRRYLRERVSTAAIPKLWRFTSRLLRNAQGKVLAETARRLFNEPPLPTVLGQTVTGDGCLLELYIAADNPYFDGHFPEQAVLPGVVQLLWAQHFSREYLALDGKFSGMEAIKFRNLVFPDQKLSLTLEYARDSGRLKFHYDSVDGRHSQGTLHV